MRNRLSLVLAALLITAAGLLAASPAAPAQAVAGRSVACNAAGCATAAQTATTTWSVTCTGGVASVQVRAYLRSGNYSTSPAKSVFCFSVATTFRLVGPASVAGFRVVLGNTLGNYVGQSVPSGHEADGSGFHWD